MQDQVAFGPDDVVGQSHFLLDGPLGGNALIDFVSIIVIVRQRRIDITQSESIPTGDFVRVQPHPFVPNDNVLNADAMASDMGLSATDTGSTLDMSQWYGCHLFLGLSDPRASSDST